MSKISIVFAIVVGLFSNYPQPSCAASIDRPPPRDTVFIIYDPFVNSLNRGLEECTYSSPDWVVGFFTRQITIESIFSDLIEETQQPTVQTSFRITFTRFTKEGVYDVQRYSAPNPDVPFATTLDSGLSFIDGWLEIVEVSEEHIIIVDYSTGSIITAKRGRGRFFNVYLESNRRFLALGAGLMVNGCPYSLRYPWQPYHDANPNLGRRKRQIKECEKVANAYEETFPGTSGFSYKSTLAICESSSQFIDDAASLLGETLETLRTSKSISNKLFGSGKE